MPLRRICFEMAEDSFACFREFNEVHFPVVRVRQRFVSPRDGIFMGNGISTRRTEHVYEHEFGDVDMILFRMQSMRAAGAGPGVRVRVTRA